MDSFLEFNTVGLIDTASINPDVAQAAAHSPITTGFLSSGIMDQFSFP
jgi:hypothetical protein